MDRNPRVANFAEVAGIRLGARLSGRSRRLDTVVADCTHGDVKRLH